LAIDVGSQPPKPCPLTSSAGKKRASRETTVAIHLGQYVQRSSDSKYVRIVAASQDRSPVRSAMSSQSASLGYTVIIALWAVQPPIVAERG